LDGYLMSKQTINNTVPIETAEINANLTERKRHGFTTFWIIFSSIVSVIIALFSMAVYPSPIINFIMLNAELTIVITIVSCILLLCWKKIGFWLFIGSFIVSILLSVIMITMSNVYSIISAWYTFFQIIVMAIINIAVMWGVLHIRKNGKTAWEQLK